MFYVSDPNQLEMRVLDNWLASQSRIDKSKESRSGRRPVTGAGAL